MYDITLLIHVKLSEFLVILELILCNTATQPKVIRTFANTVPTRCHFKHACVMGSVAYELLPASCSDYGSVSITRMTDDLQMCLLRSFHPDRSGV